MTLAPHRGHQDLRRSLALAASKGTFPSILLLHGTPGIGKQSLGLWVAQLLLCTSSSSHQGPCGQCQGCHMVLGLEHPDLHWYFPLPRPKGASTPEKLEEALEEARWEALAHRREHPLRVEDGEATEGLYLATARAIRHRASRRPSMAQRQVFVVGRAETLVSQDSSPEAANALLKVLEEPPEGTFFILTARELGRVLPTIRSRSVVVHIPPVLPGEVESFLQEVGGLEPERARNLALLSRGSIGRALAFGMDPDGAGEEGPLTLHRREAYRILQASVEPSPARGFALALGQATSGGRSLADRLVHVEDWLRDLAAVLAGAGLAVADPRAREALDRLAGKYPIHPLAPVLALGAVERAREFARGNGNPQLVVSSLISELRKHFQSMPSEGPIAAPVPPSTAGAHP